jgi:hypothetical protein
MESQIHQDGLMGNWPRTKTKPIRPTLIAGAFLLLASSTVGRSGQQGTTNPLPNRPIVIPNRTLSPDELKELADKNASRHKFDAANAARKQAIDDETNKLLILARDLKAKTDNMGSDPPSPLMLREAAVIELLANDVKEKMKLTVNPD